MGPLSHPTFTLDTESLSFSSSRDQKPLFGSVRKETEPPFLCSYVSTLSIRPNGRSRSERTRQLILECFPTVNRTLSGNRQGWLSREAPVPTSEQTCSSRFDRHPRVVYLVKRTKLCCETLLRDGGCLTEYHRSSKTSVCLTFREPQCLVDSKVHLLWSRGLVRHSSSGPVPWELFPQP